MWKIFIFIKYKIFSLYPLPFPHRTSENVVTRIGIALQNPALPVRGQGHYHHRTLALPYGTGHASADGEGGGHEHRIIKLFYAYFVTGVKSPCHRCVG